jgi:hypothetical protein
MTEEQKTLLAVRVLIAKQPPEGQKKIRECEERIRALLQEYGPYGEIALGLIGAERAAQESEGAG